MTSATFIDKIVLSNKQTVKKQSCMNSTDLIEGSTILINDNNRIANFLSTDGLCRWRQVNNRKIIKY